MAPKRKRSKSPKTSENRAAKRAAKLQRDKDLAIKLQHDELYREIRCGAETVKRHEKQWRSMLLTIAEPRIRKEHELLLHWFDRSVDAKDFAISLLLDELQAAEDQYGRKMRAHIDDIDRIILMCYEQIKGLWIESGEMIAKLYEAGTTERMDVIKIDTEHEQYLKTMMFSLGESSKEVGKLMRGEYVSRQEVENSKLQEITTNYRLEWSAYFDQLVQEMDEFMEKYRQDFARRKERFEELDSSDKQMQALLKDQWEQASDAYDCITKINAQQDVVIVAQDRKVKDLEDELGYYDSVAKDLMRMRKEDTVNDRRRFTELVVQCNEVIELLEACAKRGEKLLTLAGICSKLQTEEEKTLKFPTFEAYMPEEKHQNDVVRNAGEGENQEQETCEYLPEMNLFWLRIGETEASRLKLLEACAAVVQENKISKEKLMALSEDVGVQSSLQYLYKNKIFEDD